MERNSCGWCPVPMPTIARPVLAASSMAISSIIRSGECSGTTSTPGPSLMRLVKPAQCIAIIKGEPQIENAEK